jgi:hypothetical protein
MENDIKEILKTLKNIEERLKVLENIANINLDSSKKMDEHINFIDNVYTNVKKPFCDLLTFYKGEKINIDKNLLK